MATIAEIEAAINRKNKEVKSIVEARATYRPTYIPTGVFALDLATGGGIPESTITGIVAPQHAGKTSLLYRIIRNAQKKYPEKRPVLIDMERTFSASYAEKHGVDIDNLLVAQPEYGEAAVDLVEPLLKSEEVSAVLLDSIASMVAKKDIDVSAEDVNPGLHARLCKKLMLDTVSGQAEARIRGQFAPLVYTNQWRYKIGVMYGDPRVEPGGMAPGIYRSLAIELKAAKHEEGQTNAGIKLTEQTAHMFEIRKNKFFNGPKTGEYQIIQNPHNPLGAAAVDQSSTMITYAKRLGLYYGGGKAQKLLNPITGEELTFGKMEEAASYLDSNPEFYDELYMGLITEFRKSIGEDTDWYFRDSKNAA